MYCKGEFTMSKKEFVKRAGQIYALGIQKGYSQEEIFRKLESAFSHLYEKK